MVQTNIYEYLDIESDPVLINISSLKKGQQYVIDSIKVQLNLYGIYEIETSDIHDSFSDIMDCYWYVSKLIDEVENDAFQ